MSVEPYVVVGAGQAGLQVADSLRKAGCSDRLILVGEEAAAPYQRPPLSKKFLEDDMAAERLLFRPPSYFEKIEVELRLGVRVTALDCASRTLSLDSGETLSYSGLALTTGTRVRPFSCPGSAAVDIHYVRTLADSEKLRARMRDARSMVVIGGGFIGLEVAAAARQLGLDVVVLETQSRLMARAVSPQISTYYAALHRERGVDIRLDVSVDEMKADGSATTLVLNDGTTLTTEIVVAGIGVLPNIELAEAAGLECRNGIVVDVHARTSDRHIVAAGDCTMHYNGFLGDERRLESVQNAVDQAKVAALTLCGQDASYNQVPWFWSDQYDIKLQMAGIGMPFDECIQRGDPADDGFSLFYYRDGALAGADSVNRPAEHMACRKLLAAQASPSPSVLADTTVNLLQLARELPA